MRRGSLVAEQDVLLQRPPPVAQQHLLRRRWRRASCALLLHVTSSSPLWLTASAVAQTATLPSALEAPARGVLASDSALPLGRLRMTLHDARSGLPIAGNVRVLRADGSVLLQRGPDPGAAVARPAGWHATLGVLELEAPRERLRVEAFQGLETAIAARELDLAGDRAEISLYLERFVRARDRNLAAGNTALQSFGSDPGPAELRLREAAAADQLDFVWTASPALAGDAESGVLRSAKLDGALPDGVAAGSTHFGSGEELQRELDARRAGDGRVIRLGGLSQRALVWEQGRERDEALASWVLGRLHALHLFRGGVAGAPLRGDHASFASACYRLLDVGLAPPLAAGAAELATDLARVYVALPAEQSIAAFLRELRAGRSFISNGPLLELDVEGQGPGGVVQRDEPGLVRVRGRALGRANFRALELVVNGRVVARAQSLAVGDHFEAGIAQPVALDGPAWIVLRAAPGDAVSELGTPLFAHTSAVLVEVAGARRFASGVARELALAIDASAHAVFADPALADAATQPDREAIARLAERMGWLDWLRLWTVRLARMLKGWLGF